MKITILLFVSLILVFGNIDNLIGDFESDYIEKKENKSSMFDKSMVKEKKSPKRNPIKNMNSMDKMSPMDMAIKDQQHSNNQKDISMAIDQAIKEYVDSLTPLMVIAGLFIFLIFIMYAVVSSISSASLKHKINVLEDVILNRLDNLEEKENEDYDVILDDIKKLHLRIASVEAVSQKILSNKDKTAPIQVPSKKKSHTQAPKKKQKVDIMDDSFTLDDDFAMDEDISLSTKPKTKQKVSKISDLSSLNMDIIDTSKKKKKDNIADMESFNLDDFDE